MSSDSNDEVDADRRAHHNELERQRRDILKELFESLRHDLAKCHGSNRKPSRVEVLRTATEYMTDYQARDKRLNELEECSAEMEKYVQRLKELRRHKDKNGYIRLVKEVTRKYGRYHNAIHEQPSTSSGQQIDNKEEDAEGSRRYGRYQRASTSGQHVDCKDDDDDDDDDTSETESDDESSVSGDSFGQDIVIRRRSSDDDDSEYLDVES